MNRDEIRERFSPLLDGELSPEERAEVEAALSEDAELLRELDALKRVDHLYANLPPVAAPDGFEDGVKSALYPATLQFTRARAMRRRLWPMLAAAAVFIVVGAVVVVQMKPNMAPIMLSKEMADYAAESAPQAAVTDSGSTLNQSLRSETAPLEAADEAISQSSQLIEPEMDTDSVQGPGAVSSGPANGYFQGRNPSGAKGERPAAPMTQPEPMIAGREADRVEGAPPSQRQDEETRWSVQLQGRMEAGESVATDVVESEPQIFGDSGAGATAPPSEASAPTPMRGRDADESGVKSLAEEGLAREKPMVAAESVVVDTRTLGERTFQRRGADWIQEGYNDESLTTIRRQSEAWNVLIGKDLDLSAVTELEGRVVLKQGDIWYELLPAEPAAR